MPAASFAMTRRSSAEVSGKRIDAPDLDMSALRITSRHLTIAHDADFLAVAKGN